ncbi:MAG: hypothetical protein IAF38_05870, partial [Bacteroidia bacterium]|nr:hypothetical protein [Bacteroidia bacterium]
MQNPRRLLIHRYIFMLGLLLFVVGLNWGSSLISIAESLLFLNWLAEGNFKWKWQRMKESKIFLICISFYLLHILACLWSNNLGYAIKDLWVKAPLLLFPLLFVSTPPPQLKEWKLVLSIYVLATIGTTLWSMVFYFGWRPLEGADPRKISRFDSHIRLSMKMLMAIFISAWFFWQKTTLLKKGLWLASILWLLFFLFIL